MADTHRPGVLVTRPAGQAAALGDGLRAAGFTPLYLPTLAIEAADPAVAVAALRAALPCDLAIFISANAVQHALPVIAAAGGLPAGCRVAAVGPASARALAGRRFCRCTDTRRTLRQRGPAGAAAAEPGGRPAGGDLSRRGRAHAAGGHARGARRRRAGGGLLPTCRGGRCRAAHGLAGTGRHRRAYRHQSRQPGWPADAGRTRGSAAQEPCRWPCSARRWSITPGKPASTDRSCRPARPATPVW